MGEKITARATKDRIYINDQCFLLRASDGSWTLSPHWLQKALDSELEVTVGMFGAPSLKIFKADVERCGVCGAEIKKCKDGC